MITITRLTDFNVRALRELLTEAELTRMTVGQTVATFDMQPCEAVALIRTLQERAALGGGTKGHPYASLRAVARKVNAQAS